MLSSFYSWSIDHIRQVFEAKTETECLRAVDETFSQKVEFTFNGSAVPRTGLQAVVLSMVKGSGFSLSVDWQNAVEAARDEHNRDGVLGGYYIVRNVKRQIPGKPVVQVFERHKSVNVVIESESPDTNIDSRRIVKLALVATDVPVKESY